MKRHDADYFSLAAGLLFTILGLVFAATALGGWQLDGRWLAPVMLIALGAGGVAASLAASKRQQRETQALAADRANDWPTDPFA